MILDRAGGLPCRQAEDGDPLAAGQVLVAAPDRHLVIEDGRVRLTIGPRENNHRPSVDALFRSAAAARGSSVIGVLLSGNRDDGTAGLAAIKARGGVAVVQDPADALYPGMPTSALKHVSVDAVVPSAEIGATISAIVSGEDLPSGVDPEASSPTPHSSGAALLICPECGGVLSERREQGVEQWVCPVGHRFSPDTLADAQAEDVEAALWTAVRALSDRSRLLHRMAERATSREQERSAQAFGRRGDEAYEQAELVRRVLTQAGEGSLRGLVHDDGEQDKIA